MTGVDKPLANNISIFMEIVDGQMRQQLFGQCLYNFKFKYLFSQRLLLILFEGTEMLDCLHLAIIIPHL